MLTEDYTQEQFKALFSKTDEATIEDLYSYFSYRDPTDNFAHFITQTELYFYDQYARLLRDEHVTYDAMVTDYMERYVKNTVDKTSSLTEENKHEGSNKNGTTETGTNQNTQTSNGGTETNETVSGTNTRTDDLTHTDDTTTTNDNTNTQNTTQKETRDLTGSKNTKGMNKTNPMQVTYSTATAGAIPSLDWSSSDGQQQAEEDTTDTGTINTENGGTITDSGSNKVTGTKKDTGTETTEGSTTTKGTVNNTETVQNNGNDARTINTTGETNSSDNRTQTATGNDTGETKERYTGRHGYSAPELLQKSKEYIRTTTAFQWYCEKFNKCFIWNIEI